MSAEREPVKLQIIIGSTRDGRQADPVARWFEGLARAREELDVEVLDLRDWPLPLFQETSRTLGDPRAPTYSDALVKRWNEKIRSGDGFVLITPEYNHSVPGVLKNAIDSVYFSFGFRRKPVAFVGYSAGLAAGARAVEHLNQIMVETEAVPVRTQTLVPSVGSAFDAAGMPKVASLTASATIMLEDLAWLARALRTARAVGDSAPASVRLRAALSKPASWQRVDDHAV